MHMHTVEYYSATKRNAMLMHAAVWMDLKDMLSVRSQIPKVHVISFHL